MFGRRHKVRDAENTTGLGELESEETTGDGAAGEGPARVVLDLGALRIPLLDGVELAFQTAPDGTEVIGVVAAVQRSRMDLMAFAAPKSHGLWDEIAEAASGASGGKAEAVDGPRGPELRLRAKIGGKVRPVRLIGVDGPRWFLRAAITGPAATEPDAADAQVLDALLAGVEVVRGDAAMPPRAPLPLRLPAEMVAAAQAEVAAPSGTGAGDSRRGTFEVAASPAGMLGRNLTTWMS